MRLSDLRRRDFLKAGSVVSEVLDYIPASFRVVRHVRRKMVRKGCDTEIKAAMPSPPMERGKPGAGLLAHVARRQILRPPAALPPIRHLCPGECRAVPFHHGGWVGQASALLAPLVDALRAHVFAGDRLHGDDTPVPVLDPGRGRTREGRLWVYVRDGRPWKDQTAPAVAYFYSPDRKGEHARKHLENFQGVLHADGYAGFRHLYESKKPWARRRPYSKRPAWRMCAASSST